LRTVSTQLQRVAGLETAGATLDVDSNSNGPNTGSSLFGQMNRRSRQRVAVLAAERLAERRRLTLRVPTCGTPKPER